MDQTFRMTMKLKSSLLAWGCLYMVSHRLRWGGGSATCPAEDKAPKLFILSVASQSRRNWKPNVQEKRLFSYIHDRHIRVKVTTHALRCIDKAGGIDEYLLKTPYNKMDTEMGIAWKAKIEKMYSELAGMEVGFFPPKEEAKIEQGFEEVRSAKREFRSESRRALGVAKQSQLEATKADDDETTEVVDTNEEVSDVAEKS
uniref:Large ribosomal subunit protein bL28m n=1 Tax=Aegilops tauschii TaxID=37682 RepID=M8B388_AEGTA